MNERRRSVRQRSRLRGRVYFNQGGSLPCLIRDISYEGARIELLDSIDIPDTIDLHIPTKNRMMRASVRWRHGDRIGVAFSQIVRHVTGNWSTRNSDDRPMPPLLDQDRSSSDARELLTRLARNSSGSLPMLAAMRALRRGL